MPDDHRSGAGGGGSASTPEVAAFFFALQDGLTFSSTPTSATVVRLAATHEVANGMASRLGLKLWCSLHPAHAYEGSPMEWLPAWD